VIQDASMQSTPEQERATGVRALGASGFLRTPFVLADLQRALARALPERT
jgi:CheY-like chemotaxis protein